MKLKAKNLVALNIVIIILAVSVYAIGYEFDKAYELVPETYFFLYDAAITVYGKRWERLAKLIVFLLLVFDLVVGFLWYRKQQSKKDKQSSVFESII